MQLSSKRWTSVTPSEFPWEQEALDHLRQALPDHEPYRAWTNFELIADDGSISEIDALVLTSQGLFLVEIKSHPGALSGDAGTWTWRHEGRTRTFDNPRLLADRKAKRLKSRLQRTKAVRKARKGLLPFVEAVVFLSATDLDAKGLDAVARRGVLVRRGEGDRPTPIPGLEPLFEWSARPGPKLGAATARLLAKAMEEVGIRRSQSQRQVGDYRLEELLEDGAGWQDWRARHVSLGMRRRIRVYHTLARAGSETRETLIRAAKREMLMLQGIDHPGIVKVFEYTEHELGPALIFEDHAGAQRLDHWLREREERLIYEQRLHLLRHLTEILQFAHGRRLVHRGLSPQSVLVLDPESAEPRLAVMSWHAGTREVGTRTTAQSALQATLHPDRLMDDAAGVYLAPEVRTHQEPDGVRADVFSLGAIAYRLFSGQPPASDVLELQQRLLDSAGLDLSAVVDGVSEELSLLVEGATCPDPERRFDRTEQILEWLDELLDEHTAPDEPEVDPERAVKGDELPGGYEILERLGQGSTAYVFAVEKDGVHQVLKLARTPDKNTLLDDEAEVLDQLRNHRVIELFGKVEIGDRTGLLMARAGKETLAERLRVEGRLSLDFLERFGDDLLQVVQWLEEQGISHRDVKPENLGVQAVGRNEARHLVLFDFSLSRAPADRCELGTPPYLDPFLRRPGRQRWDLAAERFAVAMTLYEMATGQLPRWGDGSGDPLFAQHEVTLEEERFVPAVREPLARFFARALRRDAAERFDNAEQMLRAWRRVFLGAERPALPTPHTVDPEEARGEALAEATLETPIIELGLSTRAFHALEKHQVGDVRGLLSTPPGQFSRMRGVGPKTRDELLATAAELRPRFPEITPTRTVPPPTAPEEPDPKAAGDEPRAVDRVAARLLPREAGRGQRVPALRCFLGLDTPADAGSAHPNQSEVARALGLTRARVSQFLSDARKRWAKLPALTAVRRDVEAALERSYGVMTEAELAAVLLAARGAAGGEREGSALAVARAATEVERSLANPRWMVRRGSAAVVLAQVAEPAGEQGAQALAGWALALGEAADRLAQLDPLPAPAAVLEALEAIRRPVPAAPSAAAPLPASRLVRLAAACSRRAAVSSRAELYPRGLPAARALTLAAGVAHGVKALSAEQLAERVRGRYPEAEPLPERPRLDELLAAAGLDLRWDPVAGDDGEGAYVPRHRFAVLSSTGTFSRVSHTPRPAPLPETLAAEDFEQRLQRSAEEGAWLALLTVPQLAGRLAEELGRRFALTRYSFDRLLLDALKEAAGALNVDWRVVLRADAAEPASRDWNNLKRLVTRALPRVEERLLATEGTVLLTEPGLLGRYDHLDLLESLRERLALPEAGRALRGLWVVVASDEQHDVPRLHGRPLPVIGPGDWAWVPESWIRGAHLAQAAGS